MTSRKPKPKPNTPHRHVYRISLICGAPFCRACGHHRDVQECLCGYVDPGLRRHKTPHIVFRAPEGGAAVRK